MEVESPDMADSRDPHPVETGRSRGGGRPFVLGGVAVLLAAILGADAPRAASVEQGGRDLEMAIPVPRGVRLLVRSLDPREGRSIAVLDLDPETPPDWTDTVVVLRRRALPGVMVGYATRPVDLPPESASIDEWRAFAARSAVRIDPHPDLRHAMAAVSDLMP